MLQRKLSLKKEVKFDDFKMIMVIGRGAFGRVYLAELPGMSKLYAIKAIRKDVLIQQEQVKNTTTEMDIMMNLEHPFLVGMDYLFQNEFRLYFVMPFIRGGELYQIYLKHKRFAEDVIKFIAAQMVLALGYLHK
jgi:serine/threonine protein kinase